MGGNSLLGTSESVSGKEGWEFRKISTEEVGWAEGKGSGQVLEGGNKETDELCSLRMEQLLGEGWKNRGGRKKVVWATGWGEKTCCQPPGVRRQVGFKNRDVRRSTFSHGRCWDMNPMLPPVKPELELGSGQEYRTPLEFPEILGVDTGISHRKGKRKQSLFYLNLQR